MKRRESKTAPSADLLVCFPSRTHLTLMPKPICSPARPSEQNKRHHNHHHHHNHSHLKKSNSLASPWNKSKQMDSELSEPTSPKVTCAGQIKVRHKTSTCKNWQSVMEEIEKIHNSRKNKRKSGWVESFGFKKEIMQFLTCLRNIRMDFRCFGAFHRTVGGCDDEEEDEDEDDEFHHRKINSRVGIDENEASRTVFSRWFMVLQENQNIGFSGRVENEITHRNTDDQPAIPPPNALLLMRCRSAPEKSWIEDKENEGGFGAEELEEEKDELGKKVEIRKNLRTLMDEEKRDKEKDQSLVAMKLESDSNKVSPEKVKETWRIGGMRDPFSRSRSWKR